MISCPLCLTSVKELKNNSHIQPEWMAKELYDEKGGALEFDFSKDKKKKIQNALKGKFYCSSCEMKSSDPDRYASIIFGQKSPSSVEFKKMKTKRYSELHKGDTLQFSHVSGINFKLTQSFVLYCVVRHHLYLLSHGNKGVLIEKHYNKIADIINSNTNLNDSSYPITITKLYSNHGLETIMAYPTNYKDSPIHYVEFIGSGYLFRVYVASHEPNNSVMATRLLKNGSFYSLDTCIEERGNFLSLHEDFKSFHQDD